jgi:hypothetical protein
MPMSRNRAPKCFFGGGKFNHHELSGMLRLDRGETDAYLKWHDLFEVSLTAADLQFDRRILDRVMEKDR